MIKVIAHRNGTWQIDGMTGNELAAIHQALLHVGNDSLANRIAEAQDKLSYRDDVGHGMRSDG